MSFLDPLGLEELKKKKTNIFDLSGGFSTQSTQSPQAPTSAPRDQYMTPVPKATQPATQFSYNPVPNYSEGVVSPAAKNIFESQQFKTQFQEEAKNPYTPAAKAMQQFKRDRQSEYQNGVKGAIDDLLAGMPEDQLPVLYKDIDEKDRKSILDVTADIKSGIPQKKIYELYPELSYEVKNYLNEKRWEGKDGTNPYSFDYPEVITADNMEDMDIVSRLLGKQKIAPSVLEAQGMSKEAARLATIAGNLPAAARSILARGGNMITNPKKSAIDMIEGISDMGKHSRNTLSDEGIAGVKTLIDDLADFVVTNPESIFGGEMIKAGKVGVSAIKGKVGPVGPKVTAGAERLRTNTPEGSVVNDTAKGYIFKKIQTNIKKAGQEMTPENIATEANNLYKQIYGKDYEVPGPIQQTNQNNLSTSKFSNWIKSQSSELDPSTIKAVQSNPYIADLWSRTMETIDQTGTPTDLNQLIKEPLQTLGNDLTNAIKKEATRLSETGPLYQQIRQDPTQVDITPAQEDIIKILESKDISIGGNGKLNFDKSALSTTSDMTAIQKIYDRVMETKQMTADLVLNLRTFASNLTKRDQGGTSQGSYIVKQMRKSVDNVAKAQLLGLKELDDKYSTQLKDLETVEEGLFYRDARRRGDLKDNFISILKNIGGQNRANMLARLEVIMPDLGTRAEAINMIPKLARTYITPSKISKAFGARTAGFVAGFGIGGWLGGIIGERVATIIGDKIFDGMKKSAIKNIVDKISPEAEAKLQKIDKKIKAKKKLSDDEKQEVIDLRNKIKRANAENLKTAADKAELDRQNKEFRDFLDQGDTKGMGLPEFIEPTVIGPKGPRVNVPNTPERTIPVQKTIRETYGPNYENPVDKKNAEVKKSLLKKKEVEDAARESVKQNQESERLAKMEARDKQAIADFEKAKNNGYQLSDSNAWKSGDVSKLGTLDRGVTLDGTIRIVKIDGIKYPESMARPVYREKREIEQRNFGDMKNQWIIDGLEILEVKDMNDLPKEFQDRLLEIANQGARGDMGKLADKINVLIDDWTNYKNKDKKKTLINKKAETKTVSSLVDEAKKYKSAEEFVKAQGEPLYHGTSSNFDEFKNEYIGKATDPGIIGEGHYFTNNNKFSKGYVKGQDGSVINAYISADKLFDMSTLKSAKQAAELLNMDEKSFYRTSDGKIIPKDFKVAKIFGEKLQEMGYDGAFFDRYNNGSIETVIYDSSKIKTESQLKQIWGEANKSNTTEVVKSEAKPAEQIIPEHEKIKVTAKMRDNNQTITIEKGQVTVLNRSGQKKVGSYTFPVSERLKLEQGIGNPASAKKQYIDKKFEEAFPGNFSDHGDMVDTNQYSMNSRLIDTQIRGINDAMKQLDGQIGNKEYNSTKKSLLSKKATNDGSKLQTEQGSIVGQSNRDEQISSIISKDKNESMTERTDTGIQLNGGYTSDNVGIGDGYGAGSTLSKTKQSELNQRVISLIESKNFSTDPKDYTPEQIQDMLKYEGGGGLSKKDGDTSGSNDEFYTPENVINVMRDIAKKYGFKEYAEVLEPSAGVGRFLRNKPEWIGRSTGMEIDKISGTIAKITNPESKIVIGDFQDQFMDFTKTKPLSQLEIKDLSKFDVVIGNPPYKERTTRQRNLGDLKQVNRFEDYFMIRGIDRLKNGGTMVVIVPSAFMDKPNYMAKNILRNSGAKLIDGYRLPNKTFPNTDVGTDILVFKKGDMSVAEGQDFYINTADGNRFKNNPTKVLGEIGERTNRFGKMEKFVKGDASNLSKIMGSEPKPKTTIENKPVELGPLTITNLVTGKQEILDVPAPALPTKDMGGIQKQASANNTVGNITNTIYNIIESNGGLKDGYIKVESEGFMPLSIEKIGNREIAVSHTYIQNGDLMRDPEIVFKVTTFGELSAQTIQNDPFPPHTISALDEFLDMRADNLRDQGFIKRAMKTADEQKSEMIDTEKELLIRDRKELDKLQNYTKQFPGTKKPQIIKTLEDTIATREKMIETLDNKETAIVEPNQEGYDMKLKNEVEKLGGNGKRVDFPHLIGDKRAIVDQAKKNIESPMEKKTLISKKTTETVKEPVKQKIVTKQQQMKPSQATSKSLFDMPTEKQIDVIAEKIVNPVIEKLPDGVSNRILGATSLDPVDAQKLLQYQKITNSLGEVQGVDVESDPKLLNYMDGDVYVNYNYFSGDIYGKLDQLEIDKPKMNEAQYQKQREGLLEVLPTPQTLDNMSFSVTRNDIMDTKLPELKTVVDYKYDPKTERNVRTESQVSMTIKDKFKQRLREEGVPSRARVGSSEIISYFEGGRIKPERKGMVMEDANAYFDKFIKNVLDTEIQEQLVRKENIENRNIANIDVTKVPFVLENVSKTFRGSNLNFKEEQQNTTIKAAMKGSYIISLGAGHGKTMVGINAVVWNMQNGFTKRPLIIVPKQTMKGREETIRETHPTYKLNVLGSLDSAEKARQYKLRGKDTSKWIEDNTITLMTHEAYVGQLSFTDDTINRVLSELGDDMKVEGATSKKTEADIEKTEADISAVAIGKVKKNNVNMSMFDSERSAQQYNNLQKMTHEEFIAQFIEDTDLNKNARYKDMSRQELINKANEMLSIEPMYVEKMGFDMICFDELHNAKNIFSKATIQDVDGKKGPSMFGDTQGATSIIGKKTMIGANYMQYINNGRGFIGLTATPFNNQPIEVYNMMVLVGRERLKKMGINNMNDFMSRFSEFTEDLVVQASKVGFKTIQKGFTNLQSMQKLINEHIRYVGDDPAIIKPELIKKYITIQMSPLQEEIQKQIELDMMDTTKPGAVIAGLTNARVNNVSPYFTSMGRSMSFTPEELLKNSPKLDLFADIVMEKKKLGNNDLSIMFIPFGKDLHGMLAEGLSKKTGVPLSRIGIINSDPKYKKKMFETIDKAQNGELDILIGGATINEGVDLQKKGYIVYDVSMGYNPTEPVQKTARMRRQGNLRSHVVAIYPAIENSVDSFMFQKVEEKMSRINDIFSGEGEVFDFGVMNPAEEKLQLITDPEKKAKVYIEIEQRKMQRNIELIRGELNDLERWKADLVQELNTLPNLIANLERYKSYPGDYTSYIETIKKDIDSIKRKAKTARANIEKKGINLDADIQIKLRELEAINEEARNLSATMPDKIAEYIQEQKTAIANRRTRQSYLDEINEITKNLQVFENQEQQAVFKKSLLGKK